MENAQRPQNLIKFPNIYETLRNAPKMKISWKLPSLKK